MGCKRQEKWHSHLIPLEISDVQSQRKTAPTAEREGENRRLNVTPRAEPRRCCALLRAADSGKTPLWLCLILWDADELWQLDTYVRACLRALVFLCPHPHATEQSLNVPFALFQAVHVPLPNSPICLFLQTNSLYPPPPFPSLQTFQRIG